MFGQNNGKGLLGPRPASILGQPPLMSITINPGLLLPKWQSNFPPGYGEDQLSEEQISNFLRAQKNAHKVLLLENDSLVIMKQISFNRFPPMETNGSPRP